MARNQPTRVDLKCICRDYFESARISLCNLVKGRKCTFAALDGNHSPRPLREQCTGKPAGSRADLHHVDVLERPRCPRNAGNEVEVEQKILAKRFLGPPICTARASPPTRRNTD